MTKAVTYGTKPKCRFMVRSTLPQYKGFMIGPWFTAGPAFQWLADHMPEKGSPGEVIPLVEPHDIEKFEERDVLPLDKPD